MRKGNRILLSTILLGIYAIACSANIQQNDSLLEPTKVVINTYTFSVTNTQTWEPTMTATQIKSLTPSKTIIPSYTPTPYKNMYEVIQLNILVQDGVPEGILTNGQLVISDKFEHNADKAVYYKLDDNTESEISSRSENINSIDVSPDGKWMFYSIELEDHIQRVFQDFVSGKKLVSEQTDGEDLEETFWQNENVKKIYEDTYYPYRKISKQIDSGLPGYDSYQTSTYFSKPVMDPSDTYIVYSTSTDLWTGLNSEYALYNVKTKKMLGKYLVHSLPDVGQPVWSYSGDRFFFNGLTDDANMSFNFVDKSGKLTKIAEISQEITTLNVEKKCWSPNDQYIAILIRGIQTSKGAPKELFIVDIKNERIIKTGIQVFGFMDTSVSLVWSPDSKQLLVENQFEQYTNEIILFDLTTMQAGVILQDTFVYGWVFDADTIKSIPSSISTPGVSMDSIENVFPTISYPSFSGVTDELLRDEDLSQLNYASTIAEAISSDDYSVSREQVLSGALIREAQLREDLFFNPSVYPAYVNGAILPNAELGIEINSMQDYLQNPSNAPCKIVSVYTMSNVIANVKNSKQVVLVQAWKTQGGIRYLQYVFTVDDENYKQLDDSIIMPYFESTKMLEQKYDFDNVPDSNVPVDSIWIKYYDDVELMMLEWIDTGVIIDTLSYYPLEPIISTDNIP